MNNNNDVIYEYCLITDAALDIASPKTTFILPALFLSPTFVHWGRCDLSKMPAFAYLGNVSQDRIKRVFGTPTCMKLDSRTSDLSIITLCSTGLDKSIQFFHLAPWLEVMNDPEFAKRKIQFWIDTILREKPETKRTDFSENLLPYFDFRGR